MVEQTPLVVRTPADAAALGTVLGVWAHPDDESYLSAGLMALAADAGNRVVCANATLGEHGTDDPQRWPPARLARTRRHEARAAMAILGVAEHRCFDLEDGTLADLDPDEGRRRVGALLDEVQPDTVVTFGAEGMTGHADHRTVSAWVHEACAAPVAGGSLRLLRATTTAAFADEHADLFERFPIYDEGLPLRTPEDELAVVVELDEATLDRKVAALRAMATQVSGLFAAMGEERYYPWVRRETFTAADRS